jgi:hypothetical protein
LSFPLLLPLFLIFLLPMAAYCLMLAAINRRLHPLMVSGPWDAAGLLFAGSGGFLFAFPVILAILYLTIVTGLPVHSLADLRGLWWGHWAGYFLAVVGGSAGLLWLRRQKTIIYNVAPADFDQAMARLLDRLRLEWQRLGNRVFVSVSPESSSKAKLIAEAFVAADVLHTTVIPQAPVRPAGEAVLDIEPFTALCHVTLHWRRHSGLVREEVEAELERTLEQMPAPEHGTAGWLISLSAFLLMLIFLGILFTILIVMLRR